MSDRVYWRLTDMKAAISEIRRLLADKKVNDLVADPATRAAFERFLEILSEASRHIPDEWKGEVHHIPWRQVADLGNFIRHVYHRIDLEVLWSIYENDIGPLETVVDEFIVRAKPKEAES